MAVLALVVVFLLASFVDIPILTGLAQQQFITLK
jgi:hypothetical protein